jgi:hypothetical protein
MKGSESGHEMGEGENHERAGKRRWWRRVRRRKGKAEVQERGNKILFQDA